jgi:hypothetical protein
MFMLIVIKGQNMPMDLGNGGGLYCLIHIAGRKVRTRRISSSSSPLWNETFQLYKLLHLMLFIFLVKFRIKS